MKKAELAKKMIATDLSIGHTKEQISEFVRRAIRYDLYGVCVFQNMVKTAIDASKEKVKVCTVSGYPSGIDVPETKIADAFFSAKTGAAEIDMGVNLSAFKSGDKETLALELTETVKLIHMEGTALFAVLNTYQLGEQELEELVMFCEDCGVDGLKTTSGDLVIPRKTVAGDVKKIKSALKRDLPVKAEGLVETEKEVRDLLEAGADIVCSSRAFEILDAIKD